eukprot:SAG22_NODE_992_length_6129_cov_5.002488_2_plen_289_part_00
MAAGGRAGACGFIGFGTINSGIATGLATSNEPPAAIIAFDPAPERALRKFQGKFEGLVTIAESNQAVLDGADTVFVGLLPQHAEAVLTSLEWREGITVVCMVAMTTHEQLSSYVRPARALVRAVPIPPPWERSSTILLYNTVPVPPVVERLFGQLGTVIVTKKEDQLTKLWALSALMGPFYAYQRAAVEWATANGVDGDTAFAYTASILTSCANDAALKAGGELPGLPGVESLVAEQTPGGLNEQMVRELGAFGAFEQQKQSLDGVLARLEGRDHKPEPRKEADSSKM